MDALAPYAPALLSAAAPAPGAPSLSHRDLALAAHQIERFCGKRVPALPQQKREYVASWIRATDSHRNETPSGGGAAAQMAQRAPRIDRGVIQEGEAARERALAQLAATLAQYARAEPDAADTAGGAADGLVLLDVPTDHLALL